MRPPLFAAAPLAGALLLGLGLAALLESFARFALAGQGTPAPVLPTRRLVVTGLYRYVRNPMYLAVASIVLGQALILGDSRLLTYAVCLWAIFHLFVLAYEEPTLRRSFPEDAEAFFRNVPRWLPRLRPWRPPNMGR
jgi:protein-S-isoprenylcysteine O-methyltransferase Ste14